MNKLIPLSEYVLQERTKMIEAFEEPGTTSDDFRTYRNFVAKIFSYTEFLRQPLTLGMFVPVDIHGVILEPLKFCCSGSDCGCMGMPVNVSSQQEIDEYYEAKDRVLFVDAIAIDKSPYQSTRRLIIDLAFDPVFRIYTELRFWNGTVEKQEFPNNKNLTIEDLVKYGLPLTPSALKMIGKE